MYYRRESITSTRRRLAISGMIYGKYKQAQVRLYGTAQCSLYTKTLGKRNYLDHTSYHFSARAHSSAALVGARVRLSYWGCWYSYRWWLIIRGLEYSTFRKLSEWGNYSTGQWKIFRPIHSLNNQQYNMTPLAYASILGLGCHEPQILGWGVVEGSWGVD